MTTILSIKQQLDLILDGDAMNSKTKGSLSWQISRRINLSVAKTLESVVKDHSYTQELTGLDVVECEDILYEAKLFREKAEYKDKQNI